MTLTHNRVRGRKLFHQISLRKEIVLLCKSHSWWMHGMESDNLAGLYMTEGYIWMKQREKRFWCASEEEGVVVEGVIKTERSWVQQCEPSPETQSVQCRFLVKTSRGVQFYVWDVTEHKRNSMQRGQQWPERNQRERWEWHHRDSWENFYPITGHITEVQIAFARSAKFRGLLGYTGVSYSVGRRSTFEVIWK